MAIWMDDLETETTPRWRGSDIALGLCLGVLVLLQVAVGFYVFGAGGDAPVAASSGVTTQNAATGHMLPGTGSTQFTAKIINPEFIGYGNSEGPVFWFRPGDVTAHIDLTRSAAAMIVPANFVFAADGTTISLEDVPLDYRDTEPVGPSVTATAVAALPVAKTGPTPNAEQQIAALRDYFGDGGLAAMGTRCGEALDQAYKYDGGLIALCRKVRATL